MFEAQLLFGATGNGTQVFSPWMPREGDNAVFTLDVVEINGTGAQIEVTAFTKNSEDAGDGDEIINPGTGSPYTITRTEANGSGQASETWPSAIKELVRYKFVVKNSSDDWVLFRMLPPVWFDDVKA